VAAPDGFLARWRKGAAVDDVLASSLRALSVGYAAAADECDTAEFADLFTEDAVLLVHDDGGSRERRGRQDIAAIPALLGRFDRTRHVLAQDRYRRVDDGLIVGEVLCTAHHLRQGSDTVMHIRYLDEYTTEPDGTWRIRRRDVVVEWTELCSVSTTSDSSPAEAG
jgi:uncharacterized protein (TIGR02246 family)